MSHGALSSEAHETLAIGMNRINGSSCSGEGGEDEKRFDIQEMETHLIQKLNKSHQLGLELP